MRLRFVLNGEEVVEEVEPSLLLCQHLREAHGLFGVKVGCDSSSCGACTVLVDGSPARSCSLLALQAEGRQITTIEGLACGPLAARVAGELVSRCGTQCGFCTPGIVVVATWLLAGAGAGGEKEVRAALAGNLCRCTGYHNIVESIVALGEAGQ